MVDSFQSLLANHFGIMKGDTQINTLNGSQASAGNLGFSDALKFWDEQIGILINGGNLLNKVGSQGSRAAAEVHERRAADVSLFDGEALAETIRVQIIKPLLEENLHLFGGVMPPLPKVWFSLQDYKEIDELALKTGEVTRNQFRKLYKDLPQIEGPEGDELITTFLQTAPVSDAQDIQTPDPPSVDGAPVENVASTALNGAQSATLQAIIVDVSAGLMPADAAIELVLLAFPNFDRPTVERMLRSAEAFEPRAPAQDQPGDTPSPLAHAPMTALSENGETFNLWMTQRKRSPNKK